MARDGTTCLEAPTHRTRRRWPILAATVLVILLAAGVMTRSSDRPLVEGALVGHDVVRTERITYSAGEARSWPDGALHQVTVLSGTLTVDDGSGSAHAYGEGRGLVAGWAPYTARNVTTEVVEVRVSYLRPAS